MPGSADRSTGGLAAALIVMVRFQRLVAASFSSCPRKWVPRGPIPCPQPPGPGFPHETCPWAEGARGDEEEKPVWFIPLVDTLTDRIHPSVMLTRAGIPWRLWGPAFVLCPVSLAKSSAGAWYSDQFGAAGADRRATAGDLVSWEIVAHDDIAGREGGGEALPDIGHANPGARRGLPNPPRSRRSTE